MQAASLYQAPATITYESFSHQWEQLLYFKEEEFMVDDELFYLGTKDETSPKQEFQFFLENLGRKKTFGRFKLPLHCAFPARIKFLEERGYKFKNLSPCKAWEKWQGEVKPYKLSVVFSTAYPNNPASMFGHTFLRFHSEQERDLLDYGANYSAFTKGTDSGVLYALKGLFGGYKGYFDLSPYYLKVNEYIHGESRDLIEYELSLKPKEVRFLLAHLWELYQTASFDYYFASENCSFLLLEYLNSVLPTPLEKPTRWYFLPSDLIQIIQREPGLVKDINKRPSQKRELEARLRLLSEEEVDDVRKAFTSAGLPQSSKAQVWDAYISLLNYQKFKKKGQLSDEETQLFQESLVKRAQLKKRKGKLDNLSFHNQPHKAHGASRLGISWARFRGQKSHHEGGLSFQSGYHDLLARDEGLEPFSEFRFLHGRLTFRDNHVDYSHLGLIDVTSLHPLSFYDRQISWKAGLGLEELWRTSVPGHHKLAAQGKVGVTLGSHHFVTSLLLGAVGEISRNNGFEDERMNASWEFIAAYGRERAKVLVSGEGRHPVDGLRKDSAYRISGGFSWFFGRDQEIRYKGEKTYFGENLNSGFSRHRLEWGVYF